MKKFETITLILDAENKELITSSSLTSVCTAKLLLQSGLECAAKLQANSVFDSVILEHISNLHKLILKKSPGEKEKAEVFTPDITVSFKTQ